MTDRPRPPAQATHGPDATGDQMKRYLDDTASQGERVVERLGLLLHQAVRGMPFDSDIDYAEGVDEFHRLLLHCSQLAEMSRPENGMPLQGQEVAFLTSAAWVALCATKMLASCKP